MSLCLDSDMVYLIGAILGDCYLSNSHKSKKDFSKDYRIAIEMTDIDYLHREVFPIVKNLTSSTSIPKNRKRKNKKESSYLIVRNKRLHNFLTKNIGIPSGKKSGTIFVPQQIQEALQPIKRDFLAGVFDTDGGFRGKSLGFTTKSKVFRDGLYLLLEEFEIKCYKEEWLNKKYNKNYFGLNISKSDIVRFLNEIPIRNHEKLKRINERFGLHVGVPERSNGLESFSNRELS